MTTTRYPGWERSAGRGRRERSRRRRGAWSFFTPEALEARALLASLEVVYPTDGLSAMVNINGDTQTGSISNLNSQPVDDVQAAVSHGGTDGNGDPVYVNESDDYAYENDIKISSSQVPYLTELLPNDYSLGGLSLGLNMTATLAGGIPEPISDTTSSTSAPTGNQVTIEVVPGPGDVPGSEVEIELDAGYEARELGNLFYAENGVYDIALDEVGDVTSQFSAGYQIGSTAGSLLNATVPPSERGGPATSLAGLGFDSATMTFKTTVGSTFTLNMGYAASGTLGTYTDIKTFYLNPEITDSMGVSANLVEDEPSQVFMDDVQYDGSASTIDYDYHTVGQTAPFTVGLFYSPTPTYSPFTAVPVVDPATGHAVTQTVTPALNNTPETRGVFDLSAAPSNPSDFPYLLAVANPDHLVALAAGSVDAAAIALPNIEVTSVARGASTGSVVFQYSISGSTLAEPAPLALYWSTGPDLTDAIGSPIAVNGSGPALTTETAAGDYTVSITPTQLGAAPAGARGILVVADAPDQENPAGLITETDENDNTGYLSNNLPPVLTPIDDQSVAEGSLLKVAVMATDPDTNQTLTYSLGAGAPAGAAIDASTGVFTWTPPRGPATAKITVVVTDNGLPPMSATESFNVKISDVAPVVVLTQSSITPAGYFAGAGAFADPGVESWTGEVDYGDGSLAPGVTLIIGLNRDKTFALDHQYTKPGNYVVVVTVFDSGGLSGALRIPVNVSALSGSGSGSGGSSGSGSGGTSGSGSGGSSGAGLGGSSGAGPGGSEGPAPEVTSAKVIAVGRTDDFVVSFSAPMDSASVLNKGSYGLVIPGVGKKGKAKSLPLVPVSYSAATDTVTFRIGRQIAAGQKLQATIRATGPHVVRDASGQTLGGDANIVYVLKVPRPGKASGKRNKA